jgi:hypothetical protein
MQYINYLYGKQPPFNEQESFEAPYFDYLQAPLQVRWLFIVLPLCCVHVALFDQRD